MQVTEKTSITRLTDKPVVTLDQILKPLKKFAGSYGLQPFTIIEIENIAGRSAKRRDTFERPATPGSTVIFAIRRTFTREVIDNFLTDIARTRRVTKSTLNGYRGQLEQSVAATKDRGQKWAAKQARLGIDILFSTAHAAGIPVREIPDADYQQLEKNLDLIAKGYKILSVVQLDPADHKTNLLN